MLLKLRTDLLRKLSRIKLIIINADGFFADSPHPYHIDSLNASNASSMEALRMLGIDSLAFSREESGALYRIVNRLGIELQCRNDSPKPIMYSRLKSKFSVSDGQIALLTGDISDLPMIEKVNFPVAPADAPLDVKSKSYYVTYGVGEECIREVAELILKAKNHPDGLSE